MRIGILGLPQSGKRTLFSLLTGRKTEEAHRPGKSLEGVASIGDRRIDVLTDICQPQRKIYAENNFVLCPDVTDGGTARTWLEESRRCDLLCMVVRAFPSEQVYHPAGSVDGDRDRAYLATELIFADLALVEKRLESLAREAKGGATREQKELQALLGRCLSHLEEEKPLSTLDLESEAQGLLHHLNLLTRKPQLWAINVADEDLGQHAPEGTVVISAQIEQEISEMEPQEQQEFLATLGVDASGLDRMNGAAYDALGLMSFYTIGKDECRAWTIRKGSTAPVAGGKVHSDIERGFIRVEIIKYDDLVAAGSEKAAKDRGKCQVKGKDYVIEDGDICHFLFNV